MSRALPRAAALFALTLAACQPQPATNVAVDPNSADTANVALPAGGGSNTGAASVLPTAIPEALRGRWGLVPADCTSTRGDAKGLLIIGETDLKFYESRGTVASIIAGGADRFDADYAFTGEGQTWHRIEKLALADGKLKRQSVTQAGEEPGVDLTYARCPA